MVQVIREVPPWLQAFSAGTSLGTGFMLQRQYQEALERKQAEQLAEQGAVGLGGEYEPGRKAKEEQWLIQQREAARMQAQQQQIVADAAKYQKQRKSIEENRDFTPDEKQRAMRDLDARQAGFDPKIVGRVAAGARGVLGDVPIGPGGALHKALVDPTTGRVIQDFGSMEMTDQPPDIDGATQELAKSIDPKTTVTAPNGKTGKYGDFDPVTQHEIARNMVLQILANRQNERLAANYERDMAGFSRRMAGDQAASPAIQADLDRYFRTGEVDGARTRQAARGVPGIGFMPDIRPAGPSADRRSLEPSAPAQDEVPVDSDAAVPDAGRPEPPTPRISKEVLMSLLDEIGVPSETTQLTTYQRGLLTEILRIMRLTEIEIKVIMGDL